MKHPIRAFLTIGILAVPISGAIAQTTVTSGSLKTIHGPEELDLTGDIVYAINFSPNDPVVLLGGVPFTPDTAPPAGASFIGPNNVAPWQTTPYFGDTVDQAALGRIYEDIRYALPPTQQLEAHLPVTAGQTYKLQILFYGNRQEERWWDIGLEGTMSVDQVSSLGESTDGSAPGYDANAGVVFTQQFTAGDAMLDVVMSQLGGNGPQGDVNPIWQGLTLEHIVPDTDNDGLPDTWEMATFGNLAQTPAGDADNDGLSNNYEHNLGTNAASGDSDGDGLKDGLEVNTWHTNPKITDTDGDGLSDGFEVNTSHTSPTTSDTDLDGLSDSMELNTTGTSPLLTDSDGDDYSDGIEVSLGTSPTNPTVFPLLSSFGIPLRGGDAGEGLDLTGTFKYAFNVGTNGAPGLIRGVDFTDETNNGAGGITISNGAEIAAWGAPPDLGSSQDDLNLVTLMSSIRHAGADGGKITVTMTGLNPGKPYKLQLLFLERCCNRGFDILVDGQKKLDDFAPVTFQDGTAAPTRGSVAVIGFLATGTSVEVVLDGALVENPAYTDHNPILNGVTLEELTGADADGDGLDDLWEISNFGNLSETAAGDPDADGLSNLQENQQGTDPKNADTDGDTLKDGAELNTHHTNPKKADTDGDGLRDDQEILILHTDPTKRDSDGDSYTDDAEIAKGTNPTNAASFPVIGSFTGSFTGGDTGEGLDLTGTFLHAFNAGAPGAAPGPVQEVNFTSDSEVGITLNAPNNIDVWINPAFGDTDNDNNLEFVMQSIRWASAPPVVTLDLDGLTVGKVYKLQLLFTENSNNGRGFDIRVDGSPAVDSYFPNVAMGGTGSTSRNSVVTVGFVAKHTTLNITLDGLTAASPLVTDRNPTLSAATLESLTLPDSDGDGLPDAWELQFFGDLARTGTGDQDADGLTNAQEFLAGTNPTLKDTDNDGIEDKAESIAGTDPVNPDSDFDRLADGIEVNTLHTDPLVVDSDGDGFSDFAEYLTGSNPTAIGSVPAVQIGAFTGGDPGEGLDLTGTFKYAFNVGTNVATGQALDAVFTADTAPGITVIAPNQIPNWSTPVFGDTPADDVLEAVESSIRWAGSPVPVVVKLSGLTPGQRYKAQLLFFETGTNRGFNILLEGSTVVYEFSPGTIQGNTSTQGAVVSFEFTAPDAELNVSLDGAPTAAVDKNPTLSGMTLEELSPANTAVSGLQVSGITATSVTFTAAGQAGKVYSLDYSPSLTSGTWVEVNDNVLIGAGGTVTVSDNVPAHRTPGKGFWRLRDAALKPQP